MPIVADNMQFVALAVIHNVFIIHSGMRSNDNLKQFVLNANDPPTKLKFTEFRCQIMHVVPSLG